MVEKLWSPMPFGCSAVSGVVWVDELPGVGIRPRRPRCRWEISGYLLCRYTRTNPERLSLLDFRDRSFSWSCPSRQLWFHSQSHNWKNMATKYILKRSYTRISRWYILCINSRDVKTITHNHFGLGRLAPYDNFLEIKTFPSIFYRSISALL